MFATPSSQGLFEPRLAAMWEDLRARRTTGFLVVRHERVVFEAYAEGWNAGRPHGTASLAKALVGGVGTALALTDGLVDLDAPVAKLIPQWRSDPLKARITLRQLGSHTSGIEDAEADGLPHDRLTGWKGEFWRRLEPPRDPFTLARDVAPVVDPPGTALRYSNPGIAMLGYCLTAARRGADGTAPDLRTLLRDRILRPLGVPDAEWSVGYGRTDAVDGLPLVGAWGGGNFTARATARIGLLLLRGGEWQGRRLLSEASVRATTADAGTPGPGGIGWWSNADGACGRLPRDAYFGSGAGHQILLVVPSLDLVLVRQGDTLAEVGRDPGSFHEAYCRHLFEPLMDAVEPTGRSDAGSAAAPVPPAPPFPASPVIAGIDWSAPETIVRRARGSDIWALAWGSDGDLYGAYGDGRGFEPFTPAKLSMGFVRVHGGPVDFEGVNVPSPTGEALGDGPTGLKPGGMLSVNGVLHLWMRNATNAQLAWSRDQARTWTRADWRFTESFGCPTFLDTGQDGSPAGDGFVYVYSPDADSAYQPANRLVLARVPRERIREREAYEFFSGTEPTGAPTWSKRLAERAPALVFPGRVYRPTVSYCAGLSRYLLVQPLRGPASEDRDGRPDTRFSGGLLVLDAAKPWGPWTTAYHAGSWDVAPGESARFPTKWMAPDGETLHLVFSGEDSFSVRRATVRRR